MSGRGEGSGGTGRFPQQRRPLEEGAPWGKHGFPHGSEAELAGSAAGQSPAARPRLGASDAAAGFIRLASLEAELAAARARKVAVG